MSEFRSRVLSSHIVSRLPDGSEIQGRMENVYPILIERGLMTDELYRATVDHLANDLLKAEGRTATLVA